MKKVIDDSIKIFCEEILGFELKKAKTIGSNFYCASIPIYEDNHERDWFLFFKKPTLKRIAQVLLMEDDLKEEEFDDLLKEISNQIIGMAKVKLEKKNQNKSYALGTPEFLGNISADIPIKLKNTMLYKIKNRTFLVAQGIENQNS